MEKEDRNFIIKLWFLIGMLVGVGLLGTLVLLISWGDDLPGRWEDRRQMVVEYRGKLYQLYEVEPNPKEWTKKE